MKAHICKQRILLTDQFHFLTVDSLLSKYLFLLFYNFFVYSHLASFFRLLYMCKSFIHSNFISLYFIDAIHVMLLEIPSHLSLSLSYALLKGTVGQILNFSNVYFSSTTGLFSFVCLSITSIIFSNINSSLTQNFFNKKIIGSKLFKFF